MKVRRQLDEQEREAEVMAEDKRRLLKELEAAWREGDRNDS